MVQSKPPVSVLHVLKQSKSEIKYLWHIGYGEEEYEEGGWKNTVFNQLTCIDD